MTMLNNCHLYVSLDATGGNYECRRSKRLSVEITGDAPPAAARSSRGRAVRGRREENLLIHSRVSVVRRGRICPLHNIWE